MRRSFSILGTLLVSGALLAACATPAPTAAPAPSPVTVMETVVVTAVPTEAPTAAPVPTPVASVDPTALVQKGRLSICSDFPYPPMEFYDESGNPTGADVDLGNEIANRLGLEPQWVNSVFDTIIAALNGGKCDLIIADMNVTAERNKQVSFIPYFQAGQSMLAASGNPSNINTVTDVCGQAVAAESGTTEVDYLQGTADYKTSGGLPKVCSDAGKQPPTVVVTQKDSDALQQLQAGKVVVYFADTPVAAYYVTQHPDQFQLVGQVIEPALVGIALTCGGAADCTSAALTPIGDAVQTALKSMMADGTYASILTKWNLQDGAISAP